MNEKYTSQGHRKVITEEFIKMIKEGTAPWQKPWDTEKLAEYSLSVAPRNAISGKSYNGMNRISLFCTAFAKHSGDPRWCTFKQANDNGWRIKRGAKSVAIEYWITKEQKEVFNEETRKKEKKWVDLDPKDFKFRVYRVFNAKDIEGIPPLKELTEADKNFTPGWNPIERAEDILKNSKAKIFYDQADNAFYRPSDDTIHLPPKFIFNEQEDFYHTAFHEMSHWTGSKERLNRKIKNRFADESYAREELVADISSFMTCIELKMPYKPQQEKTAAYVSSWLETLDKNTTEVFKAAKEADKAANYLLEFGKVQEKEKIIEKNESSKPKAENRVDTTSMKLDNILNNPPSNPKTVAQRYLSKAHDLLSKDNTHEWNKDYDKKIVSELVAEGHNSLSIRSAVFKHSPANLQVKDIEKIVKEAVAQSKSQSASLGR